MAKKKDSVALFEVISHVRERHPEAANVPDWAGADKTHKEQPAVAPVEKQPQQQTKPKPTTYAAPTSVAPPLVDTTGGKLTLSLNYVACMSVVMAVLLLLAGAFWLGRATAPDSVTGTTETDSTGSETAEGQNTGSQSTQTVALTKGKNYLVIQTLKSGNDPNAENEAQNIIRFLKSKGVTAGLFRASNNRLIVMSTKPFVSSKSDEAESFKQRIEFELGEEYFRLHGTYRFQGPYFFLYR